MWWHRKPTHIIVGVVILETKGNLTHSAKLAKLPLLVFGVIADHLLATLSYNSKGHSQDINRAHAAGNQVQYRNSDQFPIESIALMI